MIVSFGQLATMGHLSPLKILAICRAARSTLYKIPYSSMHQWSGKHSSVRSIVEQYLHHWLNFTDWLALQPNVAISVANKNGAATPTNSDEEPTHRRTLLCKLSRLRRSSLNWGKQSLWDCLRREVIPKLLTQCSYHTNIASRLNVIQKRYEKHWVMNLQEISIRKGIVW